MKKHRFSILLQILLFNLIIAFLPVASVMMLKTYEKQHLKALEDSLVQQCRIISAALSNESSVKDCSEKLLRNLKNTLTSRVRITDENGLLLADSSRISEELQENSENPYFEDERTSASSNWLYQTINTILGPFKQPRKTERFDSADFYAGKKVLDGVEIKSALNGKYGATTRISSGGQISVTLYSALPVYNEDTVCGAVLVSRSTYRILQNLYELRLDLAQICIYSVIVSILISFFLAFRICRPLTKLASQASSCSDNLEYFKKPDFVCQGRNDEIGLLARSFSVLIDKLDEKIKFIQSFSGDVAHELKNPLASIRSSTELLMEESLTEEEYKSLCTAILDEIDRLEKTITGVRRLSCIDNDKKKTEPVMIFVKDYMEHLIDRFRKNYDVNYEIKYKFIQKDDFMLHFDYDWLSIIFENIMDNASSFALLSENMPCVKVFVEECSFLDKRAVRFEISNNGPLLKQNEYDVIFKRFYSNRYTQSDVFSKSMHTGLGLSIVKAIIDSTGGKIFVKPCDETCFVVILTDLRNKS